ncbi:MAG: CbbQ/NirQ/NorQ/GpvN family protein [Deltaproteobacteria bacterium]|nr:CbbQ/NirQ/NorQ/GpvN family protein [Deltaproteobacteria bacterium]
MRAEARSGAPLAAPPPAGGALERPREEPFYLPRGDEVALFEAAHRRRLPILLKGPTGCGKTRFVRHMAWRLGRPLVTVACHDDLSANDLTGRWIVRGGETVWQDGPLTTAARDGAICYLDEIVEARPDTVVAIHPLTDDRRLLPLEKAAELVVAHPDFQLVVSYNPGYQNVMKDLKPSTRQRFVALDFDFSTPEQEIEIVRREAGVERAVAVELVRLAERVRRLRDRGLVEVASTRLLVHAACLVASGVERRRACETAIAAPLSDDPELLGAIRELVHAVIV